VTSAGPGSLPRASGSIPYGGIGGPVSRHLCVKDAVHDSVDPGVLRENLWPGWRQALVLVQPATVVDWHRRGFRAYWRWKSRARGGRPRIDPSVRQLIRHMWSSNPTWGAARIQAELRKIGIEVSDSTIRRYRPPRVGPSSQTWRSFLDNHLADLAECVLRTPHRIHPQGVPRPRRRAGRAAPTQVLQSAFRQPHHPTLAAPANIRKVRHWTQMRYSLPTPARTVPYPCSSERH
jgi:hypothetical protein